MTPPNETTEVEPQRQPDTPPEPLREEDPLGDYPFPPGRFDEMTAAVCADAKLSETLLALPPEAREAEVLRDPRFQRLNLSTLFALRAEDALQVSPAAAIEEAALAVTIAGALPPDATGRGRRTAALAAWLLGKAHLRSGEEQLAEDAFTSIESLLPGAGLSEEHAFGPVGLAQLRWQQNRPDEAVVLFTEAASIFSLLHQADGAAACLAQAGFVLLGEGQHWPAKSALRGAYRAAHDRRAPSLVILVCLAMARCDAALGSYTLAGDSMQMARRLVGRAARPDGAILGKWWEALVSHLVGSPATQTDVRLDEVRRGLLQLRNESGATRITFHQALLRIAAGRVASVPDLTGALADAFPGGAERWAEEMSALAGLAAESSPTFLDAATDLALRLGVDALHQPGLSGLAPSLGALADHLLRHRGEHMDALGCPTGR